jgi:phytoene desaturase (3,4-didehydrolycopene-forming)
MVLLPVANIQERSGRVSATQQPDDYLEMVSAGRQLVLNTFAAAGIPIAESNILHEEVCEPRQWRERYSLEHGAAFGLAHGLNQLALLRPGPQEPAVSGLFMVGASSRPGNGVPLVMMGARLTAERILRQSRTPT